MSEAMELLNSLDLGEYAEAKPVNDIILVNVEKRILEVPATEMILGVERDKNVERKYFRSPKIVGDNVDLSTLTLRVTYENADGEEDEYIIEDLAVDGDYITFSWKLTEKVLRTAGNVHFALCAAKSLPDGEVEYEWHTTAAIGQVLPGQHLTSFDEYDEEPARDVVTQLIAVLEAEGDAQIERIRNCVDGSGVEW